MIPRTFPSTYLTPNGKQQMSVYFLGSVQGLERWSDYIPVKANSNYTVNENSYDNNGAILIKDIGSTYGKQAWKDYIPVYLDNLATDAWEVDAVGFIPTTPTPSLSLDFTSSEETLDPLITFSRSSNATRINSAGVLEYAPHNLLTYSEQFDNAAWTKSNSSITANAITAPNGTLTADKLVEDTVNAAHFVQSATLTTQSGTAYTFSCYAKAGERSRIELLGFALGLTGRGFDLSTGTTFTNTAGFSEPTSYSITPVGDGWYRCSITANGNGLASSVRVYTNNGTSYAYTGDGTSGIYIGGAQLNVGALQPYYPTTVKNLLGFSEAFENAAWTKSNSFIQTNLLQRSEELATSPWFNSGLTSITNNTTDVTDPLGNNRATKFVVAGSVGVVGQNTGTLTADVYTGSVWLRCASGTVTGSLIVYLGVSPFTNIATQAITITTQWQRFTVTTNTATAAVYNFQIHNLSGGTVYAWGAQVVRGSTAGDYQQTFSAALPVMYKAPTGLMTADKLVETTATDQHIISQTATVSSGAVVTSSFYLKAVERSRVRIIIYNNASVGDNFSGFFNLSDGTFISSAVSGTGVFTSSSVMSLGNGWYLCSITGNVPTATTYQSRLNLIASGTTISYTGDGTSGIYIWGAQVSDSASLDIYVNNPGAVPTAAAYYGPRFNYDPVTLAPQGLLIEEQRTNSIRNNTGVGAVAGTPGTLPTNWSRSSYAGMSIDVVGTGTESGITYIDCRFVGTAGASSHSLNLDAVGGIAAVTGQTWTLSSFVRIVSGSTSGITAFRIVTAEFTSGGAFVTSNVTAITPTTLALITQRLSATQTLSGGATTASVVPSLNLTYTNGAAIDITLRIGLPQLELGAFATSAIPTTTAAATRSADVATITGSNFSGFYNQNEGTIFTEGGHTDDSSTFPRFYTISDGTSANTIQLLTLQSSNTLYGEFKTSNSTQAAFSLNTSYTGQYGKTSLTYKTNDFAGCFAGGSVLTDVIGTLPVVSVMRVGAAVDGSSALNGTIKKIGYYPTRLSDQQLQNITS